RMLAETGLPVERMLDYFGPLGPQTFAKISPAVSEFAGHPDMYLAAQVLQRMEEILGRGVTSTKTIIDPAGQERTVDIRTRYYLPWEQYTRPLQYLQQHPEAIGELYQYTGREYILTEAQDANIAQLALAKLLAGDESRLVISGDPQ